MAGADELVDLHFPVAGIDLSNAFAEQKPRPVAEGVYGRTCPSGQNVLGYEATSLRRRGGTRTGLAKYVGQPVVAGWIVQQLDVVVAAGISPPGGGTVQVSNSGRVVTLVAVSQGNVYVAPAGATSWSPAINQSGGVPPLNFTGVLYSAPNQQKLWYADGTNMVYYDPRTNTVYPWVASAGALPADSENNRPRLICTWRGRTVLSGLLLDPQNWFMSAVGDPTNWNYFPSVTTPTQAVAGNNAPQGLVGDVITALVPYSDDLLIMGADHSIFMFSGDPMANGQIDLVSDTIGMAWGQAWCKGPDGTLYFVSNRMGIYALTPGPDQQPVRISQAIDQLVIDVDTGANGIRLGWDDRFQGLHVFITPLAGAAAATHLFWEQRTGAWWTETFANNNHNPLALCLYDGNLPGDRVLLIGSWDGYVRAFSPTASNDDGTPISSSVVIGPLATKDLDDLILHDLQAVLGETSGSVSYSVYTGATAEGALSSTAVATGTLPAGRSLEFPVRRAGHGIWVKLSSTSAWSMEQIRCRVTSQGKVRRRGA